MIPWIALAYAATSAYQAHEQKAAAEDAREFQAGMSSTAHQREVRDLRAAGLNPILSGTGGMGASSPMGPAAGVPDYGGGVLSSAFQSANIENLKADTRKKEAERGALNLQQNVLVNDELKRIEDTRTQRALAEEAEWSARSARWKYETEKAEGSLSRDLGEARPGTRLLIDIIRGLRR